MRRLLQHYYAVEKGPILAGSIGVDIFDDHINVAFDRIAKPDRKGAKKSRARGVIEERLNTCKEMKVGESSRNLCRFSLEKKELEKGMDLLTWFIKSYLKKDSLTWQEKKFLDGISSWKTKTQLRG